MARSGGHMILASSALSILVFAALVQYYVHTQFPVHRPGSKVIDFLSYLLSFVTLPVIRQFFTINEAYWDSDHELQGIKTGVDVYRDDHGIPYVFGHNDIPSVGDLPWKINRRRTMSATFKHLSNIQVTGVVSNLWKYLTEGSSGRERKVLRMNGLLIDSKTIEKKLAVLPPDGLYKLRRVAQAWSEAAAKLPARPIEFALLDWEPSTDWTPKEVIQISLAFSLFLNRGLTIDFCRVLLKKELGRYWKTFDIRLSDPRIPFVNSEGMFPSLFDQNGLRISLSPAKEKMDDAWARHRPGDVHGPQKGFGESRSVTSARNAESRMQQNDGKNSTGEDEKRHKLEHEGETAGKPGRGRSNPKGGVNNPSVTWGGWGGSNSWAVSGKYTASGFPILAGDPHLEAHAPGFWLPIFRSVGPSSLLTTDSDASRTWAGRENHGVDGGEGHAAGTNEEPSRVVGAAFVGSATIFVGHNGNSAWSQTIAHTDIEDLFLVKLDRSGKNYLYDGQWIPLHTRVEEIFVKGVANPIKRLLRFTHHGPLISDVYKELRALVKDDEALAFASVAARAHPAINFGDKLNSAKDWRDLVALGRENEQIEFVTIWATREGDIGASLTGGVPARSLPPDGGGDFRDGSKSSADWNGVVPTEALPHVMNPPQGFIATANCQLAPDEKDILGQAYVPGRIRRIHERLNALVKEKKITVQDMMDVQLDIESVNGREFREYVLRTVLFAFDSSALGDPEKSGEKPRKVNEAEQSTKQGNENDGSSYISPDEQRVREICAKEGVNQHDGELLADILRTWDGRMNVESVGATVYEVWMQWMLQDLFKLHKFSDHALFVVAGGGFHALWLPRTEMLNHWRNNLLRALENNDNLISDVTTPVSLLCKSASSALRWLRARYGEAGPLWYWGSVRARFFTHTMGEAVPLLRHTASIGPWRWGGNFGTIRAHHSEPHVLSHEMPQNSQFTKGLDTPTFRMVVDTGDFKNSYWSFAPGVSGWIGSRHYEDMAHSMAEGSGAKQKNTRMTLPIRHSESSPVSRRVLRLHVFPFPRVVILASLLFSVSAHVLQKSCFPCCGQTSRSPLLPSRTLGFFLWALRHPGTEEVEAERKLSFRIGLLLASHLARNWTKCFCAWYVCTVLDSPMVWPLLVGLCIMCLR
ncbi:penicillin amidase [Toxoplasma gondii TgCatPRC2]|uniref:Penicillin amidase n=3 Tax=Toxoplasma gondii TaxID=5811 RepID=A0A151H161_TOXGO|nr:penicillin amidase [Toxoplasma gondii ME49]EPT26416.1 penicillin amidase [Toxoplasma gondii ME49]KFG36236.1 penicillin amidase [Toxoplasma gondii GAB2-2007-GAL-DOM2]KYK63022.1 penicillin amidase [Toxoplasma gondii TgCatPRC2]|eukprot:XP_018635681.1 penicillin amidase [Toxoplasma gondii ME49]